MRTYARTDPYSVCKPAPNIYKYFRSLAPFDLYSKSDTIMYDFLDDSLTARDHEENIYRVVWFADLAILISS
jgi:hypothetical protein